MSILAMVYSPRCVVCTFKFRSLSATRKIRGKAAAGKLPRVYRSPAAYAATAPALDFNHLRTCSEQIHIRLSLNSMEFIPLWI